MAGKGVKFTSSVDAANYQAGANKVISINRSIAKSAQDAGHATVSQMQASSAAIRALENPLGSNLRAVERFLTTIPGVGAALKVAFPVVGALAFGSVIVETSKKLYDFTEKLKAVPAAIAVGSEAIHASMTASSDAMEVAIDKLENANAKLEKRPGNGLKLAIDEASVAMDELSAKTVNAIKEVNGLFKEKSTSGFFKQLIGDQASTADVEKQGTHYEQTLKDIHERGINAQYAANGDEVGMARAQFEEDSARRAAAEAIIKSTTEQLKANQAKVASNIMNAGRFTAQDNALNLLRQTAQSQVLMMNQSDRTQGGNLVNADDVQRKEAEERAKKAEEEASAAFRKAQEDRLKALEDDHETFDNVRARSVQDEMDYWAAHAAATNTGARVDEKAHDAAFKRLAALRQRTMEDTARELASFADKGTLIAGNQPTDYAQNLEGDNSSNRAVEAQAKLRGEWARSLAEARSIQDLFNESTQVAAISQKLATGSLTAHDAAMARVTLATSKYNDALDKLNDARERQIEIESESKADKPTRDLSEQQYKNAKRSPDNDYQMQTASDRFEASSASFVGEWRTTLNQMANSFADFGKNFSETFRSTLESVNSEIVTLLMTRHHGGNSTRLAFEGIARQGLGSVASAGIQGVEGTLMKSFGFGSGGKLGTVGNPMIVKDVRSPLSAASSASSMAGKFGNMLSSSASTVGSGISGLFKSALSFLPAFASGGPVSSGMTALVGENGPEIVKFGSSGTVIPHDQINNAGDTHVTHNWDLRYSNDSRQMKRDIERGLNTVHGSASQNGARIVREHMLRRPKTAGI